MLLFTKGLIIGFSIAAPVGPIGLLCIQRTISNGRQSGFLTGLGAATADGIYATVGALGLTCISSILIGQQFWFNLIGGGFLFYLSVKTFRSKVADKAAAESHKELHRDYLTSVFLTLANPATIFSFIAIFAGLGLCNTSCDAFSAFLMVTGVICGSALWWLFLSSVVGMFRKKFNSSMVKAVNYLSGAILIAFSIVALVNIF